MTPTPTTETLLSAVDRSRRAFVKRVLACAVLAGPIMASFAMTKLAPDAAEAFHANQPHTNGPDPGQPVTAAEPTTLLVLGAGAATLGVGEYLRRRRAKKR